MHRTIQKVVANLKGKKKKKFHTLYMTFFQLSEET